MHKSNPSTQSDCHTPDIIVKYRYLNRKHCVVSVQLFCCFGANFFSARKSQSDHVKISI